MERHEKPSKISGHEKTLKPLRFQGFLMISTRDQRLLNCGARRAALRPYFTGPDARKPLFFLGFLMGPRNLTHNLTHFNPSESLSAVGIVIGQMLR